MTLIMTELINLLLYKVVRFVEIFPELVTHTAGLNTIFSHSRLFKFYFIHILSPPLVATSLCSLPKFKFEIDKK